VARTIPSAPDALVEVVGRRGGTLEAIGSKREEPQGFLAVDDRENFFPEAGHVSTGRSGVYWGAGRRDATSRQGKKVRNRRNPRAPAVSHCEPYARASTAVKSVVSQFEN
jgi:hypothetical protein